MQEKKTYNKIKGKERGLCKRCGIRIVKMKGRYKDGTIKYGNLCQPCSTSSLYFKTNPGVYDYQQSIRRAVKKKKKKQTKTEEILGCSIYKLKTHLQETAIKNGYINFDIEDFDGKIFNIDHIIPQSKFNLNCSYHRKLCFNYTNLQILTSKENLKKSNKIL